MIKLDDELMRIRPPGCHLDCLVGRTRSAIPDILHETAMKQGRVLWDESYGSSQALLGDFTNILLIDADGPLYHVVHAQQKAHERGFSGATRPHESDALPCRDGQLEVLDDIASMPRLGRCVICKGNALEMNPALRHLQLRRAGPVLDRCGYDQRVDTPPG